MYFLSLETSTKIFSLSVSRDDKVLRFRNLAAGNVLENSIIGAIDQILDKAGVAFERLDAFAIALGPGSFTSLRVGLSTVKAFALASGKPVVGVSSLDVIAHGVRDAACDEICVLNDARRGKVYAALYGPHGRKSDYLLTTLQEVLAKVHGRTLFVGDALALYRPAFGGGQGLFAEEKFWYPQARALAALAYERLKHHDYDDADKLLPLYLYKEDCQVHNHSICKTD